MGAQCILFISTGSTQHRLIAYQWTLPIRSLYYERFFSFCNFYPLWEFSVLSPTEKHRPKNPACYVTVGFKKIKIIRADRLLVRLYYDVYLKWHMPLWREICHSEPNYMSIFGAVIERDFRENALGEGPAIRIFQGIGDKN